MDKTHRVYPILTCKISLDKGAFTYLKNYGQKVLVPVWAWLIVGSERPILIDGGCSLAEFMKYSMLCSGGEEGAPIEDSLRKLGFSASDIGTVIITHLHSDHCLNAKRFPHAKLIVQQKELEFAFNPHPMFAGTYRQEWYKGLEFEAVRGDTEIVPGIDVVLTPGHSPGNQSVCVTTKQGRVMIAGFCTLDDNFSDKGDTVPGINVASLEAYDSIIKIRKMADKIIALHSERMLGVECLE